jgi:tyrosine-protein kinase Etk/Wzc
LSVEATTWEPRERSADAAAMGDLLGLLLDRWRSIAAIAVGSLLLSLLYAFTATPVYRTNVLLQVEERESGFGGMEEFSWLTTGRTPTEAEIEILRSRMVLSQTIEQLNLNLHVAPRYFPVIGGAIARRAADDALAEPWLGLDRYAWGGERLQIDRLQVERELEGRPLELIVDGPGRYTLFDHEDRMLLSGSVGAPADGAGAALFVSDLRARPGTRFEVVYQHPLTTFEELRERFMVSERGEQTGILELSLEGTDTEQTAAALNAIANIYLRQNVERRSVEAAQSLEFINDQLPELKAQVEAAEQSLNSFRVEKGSVDLSLETQGLLSQLTELEGKLSEMQLERVERSRFYTPEHPAMLALDEQQRELERTRSDLATQIRALPDAEQDALRLTRDARVSNELYTLLLNRVQELRVVRAGTVGNVRIIDAAFVPRTPFKPRKGLIVGIGLMLGLALGIGLLLLREKIDTSMRDPKVLEQSFGLPVYAIVPRSEAEIRTRAKRPAGMSLLAVSDPHDPAVESLRSLRTSIELLFHSAPNRIITIGAATPDAGKSFVSANLAALLSQVGKTVLIVDGDLRRGHLHRELGVEQRPGLSDVVAGQAKVSESVRQVDNRLFLLPTGASVPNPAELLAKPRMAILLAELAKLYNVVLIDAPPVLAASEAATLARFGGVNLIVVRNGRQKRREVEIALDRLEQAGVKPQGFIFNDLTAGSREAYAGYRYYRYDPQPATAEKPGPGGTIVQALKRLRG